MKKYEKDVVIIGTGQNAELIHYFLQLEGMAKVRCFSVDVSHIEHPEMAGLPVVPFRDLPATHPPDECCIVNSVGYMKMNSVRARFSKEARELGYDLPGFVHPTAVISGNCETGFNFIALQGTIVEPFAVLGNNVFLWGSVFVGHHAAVGDNSFLAPRAALAGNVTLGKNCFIGANATIRSNISIGDRCLVGAGSYINKSTEPDSVYKGAPAAQADMKSSNVDPLH